MDSAPGAGATGAETGAASTAARVTMTPSMDESGSSTTPSLLRRRSLRRSNSSDFKGKGGGGAGGGPSGNHHSSLRHFPDLFGACRHSHDSPSPSPSPSPSSRVTRPLSVDRRRERRRRRPNSEHLAPPPLLHHWDRATSRDQKNKNNGVGSTLNSMSWSSASGGSGEVRASVVDAAPEGQGQGSVTAVASAPGSICGSVSDDGGGGGHGAGSRGSRRRLRTLTSSSPPASPARASMVVDSRGRDKGGGEVDAKANGAGGQGGHDVASAQGGDGGGRRWRSIDTLSRALGSTRRRGSRHNGSAGGSSQQKVGGWVRLMMVGFGVCVLQIAPRGRCIV